MKRFLGLMTAASLFFGSPAVALSCVAPEPACCCTPAGQTAPLHCPMVKATPSPVSAVLSSGVTLVPVLHVTERVEVAALVIADAERFVWIHEAQFPPGRADFSSPSSLRGPPALLA